MGDSLQKDLAIVRQALAFCRAISRLDEVLGSVLSAEQQVIEAQARKEALDKDISATEAAFVEKQDKLTEELIAYGAELKGKVEVEVASYKEALLADTVHIKEQLSSLAAETVELEQQLGSKKRRAAAMSAKIDEEIGALEKKRMEREKQFETLSGEFDEKISAKHHDLETLEKEHRETLSVYQNEENRLRLSISTLREELGRIKEGLLSVG